MSTEAAQVAVPHPDQNYPANPLGEIKPRRVKMSRRPANFKWKDESAYWRGKARFWRTTAVVAVVALVVVIFLAVTR